MKKTYETFCFESSPQWEKVPEGRIDCFNWEKDALPFRPQSTFKMCFVKDRGIFVKMHSDEKELRITCTGRDGKVWEDSCLEFFFSPESEKGYLNTEMNPLGAYLTQVGKERENRRFLSSVTPLSPTVCGHRSGEGWGVELFIPCKLIEDAFGISFAAQPGVYSGNFYKCGDKTARPHFASFSPMREKLTLGFHDPEFFATIIVKEDVIKNDR